MVNATKASSTKGYHRADRRDMRIVRILFLERQVARADAKTKRRNIRLREIERHHADEKRHLRNMHNAELHHVREKHGAQLLWARVGFFVLGLVAGALGVIAAGAVV